MYINILRCTFYALLGGLVLSVLFAFYYRLPIPFAGIIGPFGEVSSPGFLATLQAVAGAWAVFGFVFGGVIIYFVIGSLLCIGWREKTENTGLVSFVLGFIPVLAITHLDKVIGPW